MSASNQQFLPLGIALGSGIGVAVGIALHELAFYLIIGAGAGFLLGVVVDQRNLVNREIAKSQQPPPPRDHLMPRF